MASRPVTDFDKAVAAYIRSTATTRRITQEVTAERAGINLNTFRRYWRGERSISLGDLRAILDVFGVRLDEASDEIDRIWLSGEYSEK